MWMSRLSSFSAVCHDVLGRAGFLEAVAELFDLILRAGFLLAEFALDGADLLAQIGAALAGGKLALHVLAQLLLQLGDLASGA